MTVEMMVWKMVTGRVVVSQNEAVVVEVSEMYSVKLRDTVDGGGQVRSLQDPA